MREAIRSVLRFVAAPVWSDYIISRVSNATTDAELDDYIRSNSGSIFHAVGTAGMSAYNASYGVVDPDLRVKKVEGLRIVDASVIVSPRTPENSPPLTIALQPIVPAAHTQAPTYIIAERAADLIKATYGF